MANLKTVQTLSLDFQQGGFRSLLDELVEAHKLVDASTGADDFEDAFEGFRPLDVNMDQMTGITTLTFSREINE